MRSILASCAFFVGLDNNQKQENGKDRAGRARGRLREAAEDGRRRLRSRDSREGVWGPSAKSPEDLTANRRRRSGR
eukprot:11073409-Lingulodinium_polyedra.AAC.1